MDRCILSPGDYSIHTDIPALPFSQTKTTVPKPFKINESGTVETVGEHIRVKRLRLGLLQKDVAEIVGVSEDTITFWERNRTIPEIRYMPKIIAFLGYNPIAVDSTLAGRIFEYRILNGLTYKATAKLVDVNATTIASWEHNETQPSKQAKSKLLYILNSKL